MAVSIDTVYQRVLTLANKEQRGYITPQEFNLLANQAQMEIFDQYFHDIKQAERVGGSDQEYSDMLSMLYEKIGTFETESALPNAFPTGFIALPSEIYKIGNVRVEKNQVELLNSKDYHACQMSLLTSPTLSKPIGYIRGNELQVAIGQDTYADPQDIDMDISYMRRPIKVAWAYVIVNDKPLYNPNVTINFELHPSEETRLVYKILKLSGINLKAQEIVQVGQTLEVEKLQQEKN